MHVLRVQKHVSTQNSKSKHHEIRCCTMDFGCEQSFVLSYGMPSVRLRQERNLYGISSRVMMLYFPSAVRLGLRVVWVPDNAHCPIFYITVSKLFQSWPFFSCFYDSLESPPLCLSGVSIPHHTNGEDALLQALVGFCEGVLSSAQPFWAVWWSAAASDPFSQWLQCLPTSSDQMTREGTCGCLLSPL